MYDENDFANLREMLGDESEVMYGTLLKRVLWF